MKSVFVSGIPAVGKSYLANKVAKDLGIEHVVTDNWREESKNNKEFKYWADFFWNLDEKEYWGRTSCKEHWRNITKQSEVFWAIFKQEIIDTELTTIFEGVNLLPNLMKEINLQGVYLINGSVEEIFERIKNDPRWGETEELQKIEAEAFVYCESKNYKEEAGRCGYKVFDNIIEAERELKEMVLVDRR